ncbi:uncharacterized protein [Asterias amurensis]|uniref:uncharacterized protein n=1 Tax=Asterias amurensis TaxID=7602 RepID=UPI003AB8C782
MKLIKLHQSKFTISPISHVFLVLLLQFKVVVTSTTTCPAPNQVLQDHTYSWQSEWSPLSCAGLCLQDTACSAFSFCKDAKRCELHNVTAEQYPGDLQVDVNCTYYEVSKEDNDTKWRSQSNLTTCNSSPFEYVKPSSPDTTHRFIFPPFDPAEVFVMVFSVRASSTVYVGLAEEKGTYHRRMYEIAFGEKNDDKVRIRKCHKCNILHQVDLLGLMSADEYHHFWVMNYNGLTMVGKRGQPAFFTWQDPGPLTARWASIAAKNNVHADWVFHSFGNFQLCKVCGSP